ncbi:MAG: DUF2589 domain-containing protein [Tannerellaceae bacterium]
MPTPGQELSSIDFKSMIGGPLIAVVEAQTQAAMTSVKFIKEVGFKPDTYDPVYVTFKYPKEITPYQPAQDAVKDKDGTVITEAKPEVLAKIVDQELTVPILTMLPIPFIRVEETTIDFNAKIDSVEYSDQSTKLGVDASVEAKAGWGWGSAKMKVSTSFQKTTNSGSKVDRTYSLQIHVRAVQDEMPAGMEKVLNILESCILSKPVTQPAATHVTK